MAVGRIAVISPPVSHYYLSRSLSLSLSRSPSLSLSLSLSPFPTSAALSYWLILNVHNLPKLADEEDDVSNCPYYCRQPRPSTEERGKKRPAAGPQQNPEHNNTTRHALSQTQTARRPTASGRDTALLQAISLFALPQGRGRE